MDATSVVKKFFNVSKFFSTFRAKCYYIANFEHLCLFQTIKMVAAIIRTHNVFLLFNVTYCSILENTIKSSWKNMVHRISYDLQHNVNQVANT